MVDNKFWVLVVTKPDGRKFEQSEVAPTLDAAIDMWLDRIDRDHMGEVADGIAVEDCTVNGRVGVAGVDY